MKLRTYALWLPRLSALTRTVFSVKLRFFSPGLTRCTTPRQFPSLMYISDMDDLRYRTSDRVL